MHDGPPPAGERRAIRVRHCAQRLHRRQVARHQGERLVAAALACAQASHRRGVARVAGQVKSAQPLDGHDLARAPDGAALPRSAPKAPARTPAQAFGCAWKRRLRGSSYSAWQAAHMRKAAMVVLGPVVGDVADDGVARPAVGAVGEGVAEAPVGRIGEIAQAIGAGGDVRRDQRELAGLGLARANLEVRCRRRARFRRRPSPESRRAAAPPRARLDEASDRRRRRLPLRPPGPPRIQHVSGKLQRSAARRWHEGRNPRPAQCRAAGCEPRFIHPTGRARAAWRLLRAPFACKRATSTLAVRFIGMAPGSRIT